MSTSFRSTAFAIDGYALSVSSRRPAFRKAWCRSRRQRGQRRPQRSQRSRQSSSPRHPIEHKQVEFKDT